ncbi:MAG: EF-P lysine aminoacylase EpmA [Simkaniaceae bacterium]|nr:EF-P lysine aminoacylase EpmA [Candidatus Sacchlamyda saccharinae]
MRERAKKLAATRAFFAKKNVLEADTNILSTTAPVDAFIDVMQVDMGSGKTGYLHTSPEYGLKKLLASGSGDVYQLGHVFRAEEESPLHSPEFTMLEWYRVGMPFNDFIEETLELFRLFLGPLPSEILTYKQAFLLLAGIDIHANLAPHTLPFSDDAPNWDRDTQLNLLFSHLVEPKLGQDILTVIVDWPSTQAALAKTHTTDGEIVAKRFEIYFKGIELANGFDELTDPQEQRMRLEKENQKRLSLGKNTLPIDEEFLVALETLPDCCGVAVGFDRLILLSKN